jgi:hypothetical protein
VKMTRMHAVAAVTVMCVGAALGAVACGGSGGSEGSGGSGGSGGGGSKTKAEAQRFLNELDAAVRQGDTDVRVSRLNPAVIQRYGEQQCRDFITAQPPDQTRRDRVKRVAKEAPFQYSDDGAPPVNAAVVHVKATIQGKRGDRNLHLARADGRLTYFIDCGNPLPGQ